ncbi:MAG: DUF3179 domain-containing (seleno)protein [Archangium sp.]
MLLLIGAEFFRVYLIMPFPGSQRMDSVGVAYALHQFIVVIRVLAIAACVPLLLAKRRWFLALPFLAWGALYYFTHFVAAADHMFREPTTTVMVTSEKNTVPLERVVLGISSGDEFRAYPVELIGYHHQVRDQLGGKPVMVTYCTVCRTGAVFDPRDDQFRLVGMDHFNAMFEDAKTGSWWRQASGIAITGSRKGESLPVLHSEQMTLGAWLELHPRSLVLQPDATFDEEYKSLRGFDDGTRPGSLTGRNTESWQEKSWVVGVAVGSDARAFDWNELTRAGALNAQIGSTPVVVWVDLDGKSFAAFERTVDGRVVTFTRNEHTMIDAETSSTWLQNGTCVAGELQGKRVQPLQSHQEFWHAWREFHPNTTK